MSTDRPHSTSLIEGRNGPLSSKLIALACAVAVTAILFAGYALLRKRHAQNTAAALAVPTPVTTNVPKGPAKVHVLVDDPMLKSGTTIIGGTVQNTSNEQLRRVTVELELRKRKDGTTESKSIAVQPENIEPGSEAHYSIKLPAQEYGGVRLVGIKQNDSDLLAYTTGPGQKRPPEKIESKTIIVGKPAGSRRDEWLNTSDNPVRVP